MISTYLNADKTLHWKLSGNINDTDTFPHIFSLKNVIFRHEFMREFAHEFVDEFFTNFVYEIRTKSYEIFARKIGYVTNGLYCILKMSRKT